MLTGLTVVIITEYIHILNHCILYLEISQLYLKKTGEGVSLSEIKKKDAIKNGLVPFTLLSHFYSFNNDCGTGFPPFFVSQSIGHLAIGTKGVCVCVCVLSFATLIE